VALCNPGLLKEQLLHGTRAPTRIARAQALNKLVRKNLWMSQLYEAAASGPCSTTNSIVEFSSFTILGEAHWHCQDLLPMSTAQLSDILER
jgi:hypothetical protein